MEFLINSENLTKGLYRAQGIVEKRNAMPILSNVLILAREDGIVKITATDLEVGMTCSQKAEVKQAGSVAVGAKIIYEIVKNLKKQMVSIKKLENNWAEVRSGASEYRLLGMPVEEFQQLPEIKDINLFEIDAKVMKEMIEKTLFSASTDDTRYSLNGCFVEMSGDDRIRMVATDGHRLCLIERKIADKKISMDLTGGIIIPRKGLIEIRKLLESDQGICKMGRQGSNIIFETSDVLLVMRLIDGRFPDYRQVVPKEQKINLEIERKSFLDSLRRISVLTVENSLGIRLQLNKGCLRIFTSNPDLGEAREEITIDYKGPSLTIGFNARYLEDSLSVISEEKVLLSLEDDLSPCTLKPMVDGAYQCVIMPMRI